MSFKEENLSSGEEMETMEEELQPQIEPEETHILPDDPDLEDEAGDPEFKLNQKIFHSLNDEGNYSSSIYNTVKMRQRRKSIYVNEEDGDYVNDKKGEKKVIEQKKIRQRRKSVAISQITSSDIPRPAKIIKRRKTMFANDLMQDNDFPESHSIFSSQLSQEKPNTSFQNDEEDKSFRQYSDTPPPMMTPPTPASSAGSSRRKSLLKPMETDEKFEKVVSYRTTIPHKGRYRFYLNMFNKVPRNNEQIIWRLACLKVFHQYFHSELSTISRLSASLKRALKKV